MKTITFFLSVLLFSTISAQNNQTVEALFLGNSYTAVNDLPQLIAQLANASNDVLLYQSNCPGGATFNTHCTNGTMAYRREYMLTHRYNETQTHAEEKSFLDDYRNPMIQLDPLKTILVMCHADNTFDKNGLRNGTNPMLKETSMKIVNFIKDKTIREFFLAC